MSDKVIVSKSKITALADSIRAKADTTGAMSFDAMKTAVDGISGSAKVEYDLPGTTVPNTGTVEKVYFNTDLSVEEVLNIISKLEYKLIPNSGTDVCYDILINSDSSDGIRISYPSIGFYVISNIKTTEWYWSNLSTSSGWKDFNNPVEINLEASSGNNAGFQNSLLTSLISTTPFEKGFKSLSGTYDGTSITTSEDVDMNELLDEGKLPLEIKVNSVVDVKEEEKALYGTVVPNSGTIENVYFNTKLSNEEVLEILRPLEYTLFFDGKYYIVLQCEPSGDAIWVMFTKEYTCIGKLTGGSFDNPQFIWLNNDLVNNEVSYKAGWQEGSENVSISGTLTSSAGSGTDVEAVGHQNNKLINLVSTTPIERTLKNNVIYNIMDNATAVPNAGTVEKIYFNTAVSKNEFKEIVNSSITWIDAANLGLSGFEFYPILAYLNGSYPYVLAMKKYTTGAIDMAIINFATMNTIQDFYLDDYGGWVMFTNPYSIGYEALPTLSGIPIGSQNELIKNLISITEFNQLYIGKDSQFKKITIEE